MLVARESRNQIHNQLRCSLEIALDSGLRSHPLAGRDGLEIVSEAAQIDASAVFEVDGPHFLDIRRVWDWWFHFYALPDDVDIQNSGDH